MDRVQGKKDDGRMYVISGLFLICILAGGTCLTFFITLPETTVTIWYAIAGMVLVGIPWVFWFLICMFRCCTYPVKVDERPLSSKKNVAQSPVVSTRESVPATITSESPVHSPGGRHVRFGAATVVGEQDSYSEDTDGATETDSYNSHDGQEGHDRAETNEGGFFTSRESEQPLTFSMSSSENIVSGCQIPAPTYHHRGLSGVQTND